MATVGMNLALSLEGLLQRFPSLRDFGIRRLRRTHGEIHPANLAALIEGEIIPRLLVAHLAEDAPAASGPASLRGHDHAPADPLWAGPARSAPGARSEAGRCPDELHPAPADDGAARIGAASITAADVGMLARSSISRDVVELVADMDAWLARGVSPDAILVDLLAPAARELGLMWEADSCDFIDVTMGLWRLQELAHEVADRMQPVARVASTGRRALFAPLPGDDHRFGPLLVSEVFRGSGWETSCCVDTGLEVLCAELGATAYDLVGLTVTQDRQVEALPDFIEALRSASRNPSLVVMVGGAPLVERPELAFLVGADATAPDARTAVRRAESLVRTRGATGARHL